MRSCWKYALLGVGSQERVYASLAGVVYSSSLGQGSGWVQHRESLPSHITWHSESGSETVLSPQGATEFVLRCEGCGEDES